MPLHYCIIERFYFCSSAAAGVFLFACLLFAIISISIGNGLYIDFDVLGLRVSWSRLVVSVCIPVARSALGHQGIMASG
jgi:hypothetical protein